MKLCNGYLIGCLFRDFSKTAFRGVLFSRCQKAKEAFKIKVKSRLINEFSQYVSVAVSWDPPVFRNIEIILY